MDDFLWDHSSFKVKENVLRVSALPLPPAPVPLFQTAEPQSIWNWASSVQRKPNFTVLPFSYPLLLPPPRFSLNESELVAQLCPTLCDPMDDGLPGSSVHGILQARILQWVAIPFSRGSSQPKIKSRSPELQADSLPSKQPGKPVCFLF